MGRKRSGPGQFIYFFSAGLILLISVGCYPELRRVVVQSDPAALRLQEEKDAGESPWEALQKAGRLFRQGQYEAAIAENQKALAWADGNPPADRALFNLGVIYAHGDNPQKDWAKSMAFFRRVSEEFPQSPLAEESKAWLGPLRKSLELGREVVDLTQENVNLIQEKGRLSQLAERNRQQEETALMARDQLPRAKTLPDQGNFEGALEEAQRVLSAPGKNSSKDRALFQIGLIHAAPRNPRRDLDKALSSFLRLVKEYPQSSLLDEAKAWIELLQENQKLNRMIEKSKEVDIAIEEKKREKGR
jgi:tetratricopeptide (TPR) repeat protein